MLRPVILLSALLLPLLATGCGMKGDLYPPEDPQQETPTAPAGPGEPPAG